MLGCWILWSGGPLAVGAYSSLLSVAMIKNHDQKELRGETIYLVYKLDRVHLLGKLRQEPGGRN